MCGRYGRRGDKQRIAEWMQSHDTSVFDGIDDLSLMGCRATLENADPNFKIESTRLSKAGDALSLEVTVQPEKSGD